ncbi:hypothetical protein RHGRI_027033 [Rhododendron griersonianum]|uniref:Uncharacterized protein n=1 Tax=Rhododendron griersonianum TaxID=479676 RepID=A0AAV6IXA2_9ERIC|nr:hypothetical protein RHGRI_027033 [Rhododendron griersonianum]
MGNESIEAWVRKVAVGPIAGVIETPLAILGIDVLFLVSREGELISCDLRTQEIRNHQVYGVEQWMQDLPKPGRILFPPELKLSSVNFGFGFDPTRNDYKAIKVETANALHRNRRRLRRMLQNREEGDEVERRMARREVLRHQKTAAREEFEAAQPAFIVTTWARIRHETFQYVVLKAIKVEIANALHRNQRRLRRMLQNGEEVDEVERRMARREVLRHQKTAAREEFEAAQPAFINVLRQFNYNNEIAIVDPVDI